MFVNRHFVLLLVHPIRTQLKCVFDKQDLNRGEKLH